MEEGRARAGDQGSKLPLTGFPHIPLLVWVLAQLAFYCPRLPHEGVEGRTRQLLLGGEKI